ncbi:MAG: hypothetical protein QXP68_01050 [Thermosphaera sp.]
MKGAKDFLVKAGCFLSIVADVLGILLFLLMLFIYFLFTMIVKYTVNRILLTIYLYKYKVPRKLRVEIISDFDVKWLKTMKFGFNFYNLLKR